MRARTGLAGIGLLVAAAGSAGPALAHGGRFSGPVGLPMPSDPTPPGAPGTPPGTPGGGGAPGGPLTGGGSTGRRTPPVVPSGWRAWWAASSGPFLAPAREGETTDEKGLAELGRAPGNRGDAGRARAVAVDRHVVPTILWALDPDNGLDADARAAAYLALGKVARGPVEARLLLDASRAAELPPLAREGAILALGLLRRTDPALAIDPSVLDAARVACLEAFDDERLPARARAFAALALGCLGDQASARASAADREGRWVARETWTRFSTCASSADELQAALLVALSLQRSEAVPSGVLDGLRALATQGRVDGRPRGGVVRAHAVLALARLAPDAHPGLFLSLARRKDVDLEVRRAALAASGATAASVEPALRADAAASIAASVQEMDPETRGVALVAAARLLAADAAEGSEAVLETAADEVLLEAVRGSLQPARPFAAVALGVALREVDVARAPKRFLELRARAVSRLREEAAQDLDPAVRGAFFLALGLAREPEAAGLLRAFAQDRRRPADARGEACVALGLLGDGRGGTLEALRAALVERSSEELRGAAAVALGLLGDRAATPLLLADLGAGGADHVLAQLVLALAALDDPSAAPAFARLVRDPEASDTLRALACAGLGLLGDPERVPSLSRLGRDGAYLAGTDAVREALSLL